MAEAKDYREKIKDKRFEYWLKAHLAISIATEVVRPSIDKTTSDFHKKILRNIKHKTHGILCDKCTIENVLPCTTKSMCIKKGGICQFHSSKPYQPCPNHVCELMRKAIKKAHIYKCPRWKNTKAEKWYSDAWELAKCYMPDGYSSVTEVGNTDFNGLISVVLNHRDFELTNDKSEFFKKVKLSSNDVRHTSDIFIEEEQLERHLSLMAEFLNQFLGPNATKAIERIEKLKDDAVTVSTNDREEILKTAIQQAPHQSRRDELKAIETEIEDHASLGHVEHLTKPKAADDYHVLKKNLKEDLIVFNEQNHSTLPVSPLMEEHDTLLENFYVPPTIESTDAQNTAVKNSWIEPGTPIYSIKDMFCSKSKSLRFKEIYLTSGAGMGKTAFCKHLVMTWCQVHKTGKCERVSDDDIALMKIFEYVFLVQLRKTCHLHCDVGDMIYHQIVKHLSREHDYSKQLLFDILHKEECLVILDGLDEWRHPRSRRCCCIPFPEIPHRKAREHCSILSTSRPWKLSILKLNSSQIDKHFRITKLGESSTEQLIKNAFGRLKNDSKDLNGIVEKFKQEVGNKCIDVLNDSPLILTYLVCLWFQGNTIGHSRCEIYSNLLGLHLSKADEKQYRYHNKPPSEKKARLEVPDIVRKNVHCEKYFIFLTRLGRLAFETYVDNNNREFSLVFERSTAKKLLEKNDLSFSLHSGLLTQYKVTGEYMTRRYRMAFAHKTFQEFLAALYINTEPYKSRTMQRLIKLINSVENFLSVSDLLTFLSGLCPDKVGLLFNEIRPVIANSHFTNGYRSDMGSWNYFVGYNETIKNVQNVYVECAMESKNSTNELLNIEIEDFIIDSDYKNEEYSDVLRELIARNRQNVKSIKVRDIRTRNEFQKLVDLFTYDVAQSLEKIDLKCFIEEEDLDAFLQKSENTLKCFVIKGGKWEADTWTHKCVILSNASCKVIKNLIYLEKLYLRNIEMNHEELECLVESIKIKSSMKQIGLKNIKCNSHDECPGVNFDLSNHSSLQCLEIAELSLSTVKINTSSLEICYVGKFSSREMLSRVLRCLKNAMSLHRFYCGFLTSSDDVTELLATIPKLVSTEYVWLTGVNIGNNKITLSPEMVKLEKIILLNCKMDCNVLEDLFQQTIDMNQALQVGLFDVDTTPGNMKEDVKDQIRNSNRTVMILDTKRNGKEEFLFKTVH